MNADLVYIVFTAMFVVTIGLCYWEFERQSRLGA